MQSNADKDGSIILILIKLRANGVSTKILLFLDVFNKTEKNGQKLLYNLTALRVSIW